MNIKDINNQSIFSIDWAAKDRAKMLRSIPAPKPIKHCFLAPGLSTKGLCGQDVSILDRRSVKARLSGRGDLRASWWNLYSAVYRWLCPRSTLEERMYSFHKRHQGITLCIFQIKSDYSMLVGAIRAGGAVEGLRCVRQLSRQRSYWDMSNQEGEAYE